MPWPPRSIADRPSQPGLTDRIAAELRLVSGALAFDGEMALMIFRPTATSGIYTVVGLSDIKTLAPVAAAWKLKTFRGGDLHVEGGDLLGFYTPTSLRGCDAYTATAGDTTQYRLHTVPVVGADTPMMSDTTLGNPPGYHLEISATLFPEYD